MLKLPDVGFASPESILRVVGLGAGTVPSDKPVNIPFLYVEIDRIDSLYMLILFAEVIGCQYVVHILHISSYWFMYLIIYQ